MKTLVFLVRQTLRRVPQVFATFDNPWSILFAILTRRRDVTFNVDGMRLTTRNSPAAWGPILEIFVENEYDLDWFLSGLSEDVAAVDIGAHVGSFALELTRRKPRATVHAYEPTPSTGEYTDRNVAQNSRSSQITVHHVAVAATSGTFEMADNGPGRAQNGVLYLGAKGSTTIEVQCRSFAEVMAEAGGAVEFIKLDAEGAEYDILLNSEPSLLAGVRRFVLEFHPSTGHSFADLHQHLQAAGLTQVRHVELGPELGLAWFSRDDLD